jgi:hypothetical protein
MDIAAVPDGEGGMKKTMMIVSVAAGVLFCFAAAAPQAPQSPAADKLAVILQKARDYCLRLDKAALDFVCQEQVEEEVNQASRPSVSAPAAPMPGYFGGRVVQPARVDNFSKTMLVYDYQFIRKGSEVKERRDLLEKNGDKLSKTDAAPETKHFKFRDILSGASGLLGAGAGLRYEYKLAGEDKIRGEAVANIDCVSSPALSGRQLAGRAVVRVKDGAVLRIDWDPRSFGSYHEVQAVADLYGMKPKVQSFTEYGIEKNGVRFPTYDFTEEAYSGGGKITFVRSTTQVKYKSYKFFTVETLIEN